MKTLKNYIIENNNKSINNYVNEGFLDGLKNFWNWLVGNNDKNDYDRDGYYRPDIDYDKVTKESFLFKEITDVNKTQEIYKKYFSKDKKLNKNCKQYSFSLPTLSDNKKISKDKLKTFAVICKNEEANKEKLIGLFTIGEYDNITYVYKVTIIDWFIYSIDKILNAMVNELKIESHILLTTSASQKFNFLEQQHFNYNNTLGAYEKTY